MEWDKHVFSKLLVLIFQGTSKSANYWTKNLEQFREAVVLFLFVDYH